MDCPNSVTRREVLKSLAATASVSLSVGRLRAQHQTQPAGGWGNQIGLEMFTVRDLLKDTKSYEATCEKIAAIGYKEIEPFGGYGGMDPKTYRAMLDRLGLSVPTTHSGATEGPYLEKQLEGFQVMGLKYIEISAPRPAGAGPGGGPGGPGAAGAPRGAGPGGGAAGNGAPNFGVGPQKFDAAKRTADELNRHGEIAKKFGMKILVHNHTVEFVPLSDRPELKPYDVILQNTDPALVAMQMDIGWAVQAGQDPLAMFKKSPGRYELWHVKDMNDIKLMPPNTDEGQRMAMGVRAICPIGTGDIDYKPIFEAASVAGLKHFCIEQDSAADWGDSLAAAGVCYRNLKKIIGSA